MTEEYNINQGYILLHRKILDSKLWSCSDATLKVAIFLLLSANHKDRYYNRILIKRGQCVRSLSQISEGCNLSRKAVRYALKILEEDRFLTIDAPFGAQQGHRLIICKYGDWQNPEMIRGTRGAHEGHTRGTEGNTNNNDKNGKNEEECKEQPKKRKASSQAEKVKENSPLMIRIGSWFKRKPKTLWLKDEAERLTSINPDEDEVEIMAKYYEAVIPEGDFRRRNIDTLLNNWRGELDRAAVFAKTQSKPRNMI
jgi:hypothetical protein